ncbi:phage integrase family protein [Variovorax ginsengisoli]|uniref:Site-specific recombinase XerD n=1 Tax=Variovorax ginsengisoli TaxID=363844 RepID=A0ABT9S905_9BURK|nr:phage integrase family protein [Variovorax ginsengisoli]MDP9900835.1 site-specific recombinase XerD [Variovorax ginsengisoli]
MKQPPTSRKLDSRHFAFMRAVAQGLDERASWNRYLRVEGEHGDARAVRKTIAWIRNEFAAAAKRERRPGLARLIHLDPDRIAGLPTVPGLAEFAVQRGLEDFSEAEQLEAYALEYPREDAFARCQRPRELRRARLITRQLEAIQWLQDLVAQDPAPDDSVSAWFHPLLAVRLEAAGLATLRSVVERINAVGARWWRHAPAIGPVKATRIAEWLQDHSEALGLVVAPTATAPSGTQRADLPEASRASDTGIVPFEKFLLPLAMDGRHGRFRAPLADNLLAATNDHQAIGEWLASKAGDAAQPGSPSTQRSYRKEAERLLLWGILERQLPLSSIDEEDVRAFCLFLRNPPPGWCGPRHCHRWSPQWRPLEGPLSDAAMRQALIILRSLFTFLVENRYVTCNPFSTVALPQDRQRLTSAARVFSDAEWKHLVARMRSRGATAADRRLARGLHWIYETGLGLSELVHARCSDLRLCADAANPSRADWQLTVKGRGGRRRSVAVPQPLVDELAEEMARCGLGLPLDPTRHHDIPVLGRFAAGEGPPRPWSTSGLYQAVKAFLADAAEGLPPNDAAHLRAASTHWLRHTHRLRSDLAG